MVEMHMHRRNDAGVMVMLDIRQRRLQLRFVVVVDQG